jgi:microcystin-dependent protein
MKMKIVLDIGAGPDGIAIALADGCEDGPEVRTFHQLGMDAVAQATRPDGTISDEDAAKLTEMVTKARLAALAVEQAVAKAQAGKQVHAVEMPSVVLAFCGAAE